ncbi:MAG: helix-turn-helix transcriptional regulator [Cyclobacteriaceae bacterium]
MEINDRISDLINKLELNPNSFADAIGVTGTVIYNIIKGRRSKPSFEVLQKILLAYQTINANWLLNGDGKIWKEEVKNHDIEPGYIKVEKKISALVASLKEEVGDLYQINEIEEVVATLLEENVEQKFKIISLYEKQDQILDVIRKKLSLDF